MATSEKSEHDKNLTQHRSEHHPHTSDTVGGAVAGLARAFARGVAGLYRALPGTLSGLAEETAGYPLDLIKTRMQVATEHVSAFDVLRDTVKKQGLSGLFRGIGPPLASSALITSVIFGTFESSLESYKERLGQSFDGTSVVLAGATAGLVQSFVTCPVELVKNRLQVAHDTEHSGLQMANMIRRNNGVIGLYRGLAATLWRDVPGYAIFFGVYEGLKRSMLPKGSTDLEGAGIIPVIVAGGTAGTAYHVITYPLDVIKSVLQTQPDLHPKYKGILHCGRELVRMYGFKVFLRGLEPVAIRSFPANAVGFLAFEFSNRFLAQFGEVGGPHH
mmetsp:Transcript_27405/g.44578  ORF Transcript_27405/g.44578 Transcript_27405/m.44578 type:complete len:331 (-) Transcript_27405:144-1136(-)